MLISQKRVRNLSRRLAHIDVGATIVPGLTAPGRFTERLTEIGLDDLEVGNTVLPGVVGPVSKRNAEGWHIIRRDQEMETAYRRVEWTWEQFRGRDDRESVTDYRDVPYKRYPREFVPPPAIELTVAEGDSGDIILVSPPQQWDPAAQAGLVHTVNLYLELFGECELLGEAGLVLPATRRVNWEVLPKGQYPWEELRELVEPIIEREPSGNRAVIRHHFEEVSRYAPTFTAIGRAGFQGYVVFGFEERDLYVFESARYGNATYVFKGDWKQASKLTKAEILAGDLAEYRIVHLKGWEERISQVLS